MWIALAAVFAVRSAPTTDTLRAHGGHTTATIAVLTPHTTQQAGSIGMLYVVDKKVYAQTLVIGARTASYRRGQVIPVYYDKQDPVRYSLGVVAKRSTTQWLVLGLLSGVGLLLLAWAVRCLRRALTSIRQVQRGEWASAQVVRRQLLGNRLGPGTKAYLTLDDERLIRVGDAPAEPDVVVSTQGRRALLIWPEQHQLRTGALARNAAQEARWKALLPKT